MKEKKNINKPGIIYRFFRGYIRFLHDKVYYKKVYSVNEQAVPADGTPVLIVSNHQNCLNDPLGVVTNFHDRKPNIITRADVFAYHPLANKFLRGIGLLPAFRINYEGEAALGKNQETFKMTEEALLNGNTIVMYPEAGHQDKHWLGAFSFGYTKMAFEAAEMGNFEKEIFILPSCNHYSDYFGIQNEFMIKYGEKISLKPFYELYKTKPRTAQREVNKLVRKQIEDMMLDIRDVENYDAIDFIRVQWGGEVAKEMNLNAKELPQRLLADKAVVKHIEQAKETDKAVVEELYANARELKQHLYNAGFTLKELAHTPALMLCAFKVMGLLALLPLWIFSLWPSFFSYAIPMSFFKAKFKDPMFEGTMLFVFNALLLLPLFVVITFIITTLNYTWWIELLYVALFPALILFAWKYKEWVKTTIRQIRFHMTSSSVINKILTLRGKIDSFIKK